MSLSACVRSTMGATTLSLIALFAAACSHAPVRPKAEDMTFPFGTYRHHVTAQPLMKRDLPKMDLVGVVKSEPNELRVVGLSPVGSTVFRIHEDLKSGKIEREFYVESLKQHERHFMALYEMIKAVLFAPKGRERFEFQGAKFHLSKPDEKSIPRLVEIEHPYLNLKIEVTDYVP